MANNLKRTGFEEIEHTADWALRIYGRTPAEFLINAARGMTGLLAAETAGVPLEREEQIELEAIDLEALLVNWLSELAYWAEVEQVVFREFELAEVSETHLKATIRGGSVSGLNKHIKAVTYHNLNIVRTEQGLTATVVFDV